MTLTHYVPAGIDCMEAHASCAPGQGQHYRLWESVSAASSYIYFSESKDISRIQLPLLLHWQQTGVIFLAVQFRFQKPLHLKTWPPSFHKRTE